MQLIFWSSFKFCWVLCHVVSLRDPSALCFWIIACLFEYCFWEIRWTIDFLEVMISSALKTLAVVIPSALKIVILILFMEQIFWIPVVIFSSIFKWFKIIPVVCVCTLFVFTFFYENHKAQISYFLLETLKIWKSLVSFVNKRLIINNSDPVGGRDFREFQI